MAKDRSNTGGPSVKPKDEPVRRQIQEQEEHSAQSQSKPLGDSERRNREGAGKSRRSGTESNASNKRS